MTTRPARSTASSPYVSTGAGPGVGGRTAVGGQRGAAQHRADPRFENLAAGGLDDVVVGAGLQPEHHIEVVTARGEHDDRQLPVGADQPADLEAVLAGQHQVQQDDVGAEARQDLHPLLAAGRGSHVMAAPSEREAHPVAYGSVILDQKYPWHGNKYRRDT